MKFIAEQKKTENIAEYLLYMWQMEDLVRGNGMDPEQIEKNVIGQIDDAEKKEAERAWFNDLIERMRKEGIAEKGHLSELEDLLVELYYLHNTLLNVVRDKRYSELFQAAMPHISALQKKGANDDNEIETCLNGLYGLLMLRLRNEEVSKETGEAMESFRQLMAYLSEQYKKMKAGELDFHMN